MTYYRGIEEEQMIRFYTHYISRALSQVMEGPCAIAEKSNGSPSETKAATLAGLLALVA